MTIRHGTHLGELGYVVGNERRTSTDVIRVYDPATTEEIATVPEAGPDGVDVALENAVEANAMWTERDGRERGRLLSAIADTIRENADRLAAIETLESGRPITESGFHVEGAANYFEYFAGLADKIEGEQIPLPGDRSRIDYTVREPYGVTGHVVPWNASIALASRSFAPALAAGNVVVAKVSSPAPLSVLELAELAGDAGLPPGVLNVVTGSGSTTGDALVGDPRLNAVEFTGSTGTGIRVMKRAAETVSPVHLELGGKGANLVFPDADLDAAARSVIDTFQNAGQICYAPTRLFVHEEIYDSFVAAVIERVESMTVGPGFEDPDMGPLISSDALQDVIRAVETAERDDARVLTGGSVAREEGHFYEPTLLENVPDDAALSCEELFGPVFTVYEFESTAEAVDRANDVQYGLNNVVWTTDLTRAHAVAGALESGTVQVNEYPVLSPAAPSGGMKRSGIGRSKGQQAIETFTQRKNVVVSLPPGERFDDLH
ncbi:MAG: aldehyde dehydrogenase family protein [Halorubrum sp.]